ncbi:MAG: hypothetical protein U9Q76_00255, partial [candidate division WOR-3 bacterium]|nr:hypothetical protein [candidate division WOR-3 bacterium]
MQEAIKCLILTPFDAAGRRIRDTLECVLREHMVMILGGVEAELSYYGAIVEALTSQIKDVNFIIADISRMNPNVMYEMGFAHALGKPIITIAARDSLKMVPFDLSGRLILLYDP